ncbi:MAG: flavin reductase family protein [Hyphomicrobiales bacterium]|nr:flavin reductase family protein [Hyphomicrobiales bacterium]
MTLHHPIDLLELRKALGLYVTGVTIVATLDKNGNPRGFTANSFTSVSLDPPLVLICIAKSAASYPVFAKAEAFAVNILAEQQREVSGLFASKSPDKFAVVEWRKGRGGSPLFEGVTAWLDCRTTSTVDAGDHLILIGEVIDFHQTLANPLAYCRGGYLSLGLSQNAVIAASGASRVGAILECDGRILMLRDSDGGMSLPIASNLGPEQNPRSLMGILRAMRVEARINFLFAVFEDGPGERHSIFYRGIWHGQFASEAMAVAVPTDEIPWSSLHNEAIRSMLQRFIKERGEDAFSVYAGGADTGMVATLAAGIPMQPIGIVP